MAFWNGGQPMKLKGDEGESEVTGVRIVPAKDPSRPAFTKTLPGEIASDEEIKARAGSKTWTDPARRR